MSTSTKVLEIGNHAAGYAGKLFAYAGCDVTRIEPPARSASWVSQESLDLYLHLNKRRVSTQDSELIADLASAADVVVVDARTADEVSTMGFHDWKTRIKTAITPFGLTGPDNNRAATSATILALGGYTNLMGDPDREPLTVPGHYVDFQAGGFAYTAASACLFAKEEDTIDIGMLEVVMALSQFTTVMWTCANRVRSRHVNDFWWVVPTNLFKCNDGWVYINIVPQFWDAFTTLLQLPELTLDERFTTNTLRMEHRDALHEIIADVFKHWSREEIQQRAEVARVPIGAVLSFEELLDDPHLSARGVWQTVQTNDGQSLRTPRIPFVLPQLQNQDLRLHEIEVI